MISHIVEWFGTFAVSVISSLGHGGIFFLMVLESMVVPIPSELVMPFAGFLISQDRFGFFLVVLSSTAGSLVGSLISYYIGKFGGNSLIIRYGKYLLLDVDDLKKTENWFELRGEYTIFVARFIPVVRHLISIPAGIGNMHLGKFCLYTVVGAGIWNFFLTYMGFLFGENWDQIRHYSEPLTMVVAILLVCGFIYVVYKHLKNKINKAPSR